MKIKLLFTLALTLLFGSFIEAQSVINITTSGGSFPTEKWVNITTGMNGAGTQVWGQGNGTYADGAGLINQDVNIAPGTYYVNCYDQYSDGWDGTLISVTSYGSILGDNGGSSPSDSNTVDIGSGWEPATPELELEASFQITVTAAPSCSLPISLSVANTAATSIDFLWVAGASETLWDIEYGTAGFVLGTGTSINSVTNNLQNVSGLTPETSYDFYVRADCTGGDISSWAGPLNITTSCNVFNIPFSENFDTTTAGGTTTPNAPDCWSFIDGGSGWAYVINSSFNSQSGSQSYRLYNGSDSSGDYMLISPPITELSTIGLRVDFSVKGSSGQELELGTMSNPADVASFTVLNTITLSSSSYEDFQIDVMAGTDSYFAVRHGQTGTFDTYYLDDFSFTAIPSCIKPSALDATSITATTAELSWTSGGSGETAWEVEYGTDGFIQGAGTIIAASSNPFTLNTLTESTDYDYYVRANCGGGDVSNWSGTYSFSTPASCLVPTSLDAANITSSSADLSWTSGGSGESSWEVEYGVDGFIQGAGIIITPTTNPYNLNGLTPSTDYDYYVRANCGAGDYSEWVGPSSFITLCAAETPDYLEDFTTYIPQCWEEAIDGDPVNGPASLGSSNWAVEEFAHLSSSGNGGVNINIYQTDDIEWLLSPQFDLSAGGYEVNLDVAFTNYNATTQGVFDADDDVRLLYTLDGITWNTIVQWNAANANTPAAGGETFNADLSAITGSNVQFAIYSDEGASATGDKDFHIDNFQVRTIPSCQEPTTLTAINITATSADLGWTVSGSAETMWDVEYGITGFTQGGVASTIVDNTSNNPYNASGLTESTDYDFYVRAHCGVGNESAWAGPFSFSTPASCLIPTALSAANITATSVDLSWTSGGSGEVSWEIEHGTNGFTQGAGTIVTPATNPFNLNGLTANTAYDYYVRANCDGGDFSEWVGPFSFTTLVGPHNYPLIEDFENGFSLFDNGDNNDVDFSLSTIYYHTGSQSAHNDYDGNDDNYLNETGILDLSTSTNPELKFWQIAKTEGTYDKCYVQISIDGGSTYLDLPSTAYSGTSTDYASVGYFHEDSYAIWGTGTETPDNSTWWQEEVFSLAAYKVANVRIRFFLESDFSGNREGWFIDDISISEKLSDYIWNGTSWNNTPEGNITSNDNMIIQSGTMPSLTGAISVNDLTIETGASLEVDNGNITVSGDLVNNGTISGSNEVVFTGTAEFITGTGTMNNLTVGSTGAIVVAGQQSILEQLDVISGGSLSVDASGDLTLVSNAMGTARVDAVDAGSITGNVNVERYIPAGNRAFRFLGSTVSGASVFDSWQEAGNNSAGFGVQVTGTAGTVGTVNINGHDETATGNQSLFKWDSSAQSWVGVTNTKTEILNAGDFYRVFVRGDRMNDLNISTPSSTATTLRATGTLMTGAMTVTPGTSMGEFFALSNPYQSKLSMAVATTAGVAADMYYWDPNVGPHGTYSTISISGGVGTIGNATNVLEPGQAIFFADSGTGASITLEESDKVNGNDNLNVFSITQLQQALRLKLYQTSRFNNNQTESDGLYIDFDASHNLNLDSNDAVKWNGLNANIAISKSNGELLSVERRTLPTVNEVVGLNITDYLTTAYTFNATLDVLPGMTVYLKDNFTGIMTEMIQGTSTSVDFTVDLNNSQSVDAARFEIVFQRGTLGNDNHLFNNSVNVYPNPVNGDVINISLGSITEEKVQVTLFNTLGQQVISRDFNSNSNDIIRLDNLSSLESGLYILNISNGIETVTKKIILK